MVINDMTIIFIMTVLMLALAAFIFFLEKIPPQRLAEVIKINLKDFRYTYENREDEKESSEKILTAIKNLQPETEKEK